MLKALELVGFKSFADRTRFEFPPGITVVVGPNGSGKSNVVDAIKWVLGEQSVKSLRGREMADVIFNGSGSRRAHERRRNHADASTTRSTCLAVDTPEVHITRRVYRSGEGEYLINRNPARLRDIRDLLSGTGMGTQAYSVIEQGKVDVLLQSSPRDRRVIFEEAAGISRFKLRKVEALRRLERVEQNLLRLSDIVDEVENRLRSVRTQAGKARRYKEHTDRLQELRTQVGLVDWKRLSERLGQFEAELQSLGDERNARRGRGRAARGPTAGNRRPGRRDQRGDPPGRGPDRRQPRADRRGRIDHRTRAEPRRRSGAGDRPLPPPIGGHERPGRRSAAAIAGHRPPRCKRPKRITATIAQAAGRGRTGPDRGDGLARPSSRRERAAAGGLPATDAAGRRPGQRNQLRWKARWPPPPAARAACGERIAELDRTLDALQRELDAVAAARRDRGDRAGGTAGRSGWPPPRISLPNTSSSTRAGQSELSELRQRRSGAAERAAVLEELVRRHEGLGAGVKEVLARAANPADPVFRSVRGLVADLFHVSVEAAPLVEIALGQAAQHVVATPSTELLDFCRPNPTGLAAASASSGSMAISLPRERFGTVRALATDVPSASDPISKAAPACSAAPTGSSRREPQFRSRWPSGCWATRGLSRNSPTPCVGPLGRPRA